MVNTDPNSRETAPSQANDVEAAEEAIAGGVRAFSQALRIRERLEHELKTRCAWLEERVRDLEQKLVADEDGAHRQVQALIGKLRDYEAKESSAGPVLGYVNFERTGLERRTAELEAANQSLSDRLSDALAREQTLNKELQSARFTAQRLSFKLDSIQPKFRSLEEQLALALSEIDSTRQAEARAKREAGSEQANDDDDFEPWISA